MNQTLMNQNQKNHSSLEWSQPPQQRTNSINENKLKLKLTGAVLYTNRLHNTTATTTTTTATVAEGNRSSRGQGRTLVAGAAVACAVEPAPGNTADDSRTVPVVQWRASFGHHGNQQKRTCHSMPSGAWWGGCFGSGSSFPCAARLPSRGQAAWRTAVLDWLGYWAAAGCGSVWASVSSNLTGRSCGRRASGLVAFPVSYSAVVRLVEGPVSRIRFPGSCSCRESLHLK